MLEVDVSVVETTDSQHFTLFFQAIIPDELGHRPRFEWRFVDTQVREVANEHSDQIGLTFPEAGEQFAFFFGGQQVRGKSRELGFSLCNRN